MPFDARWSLGGSKESSFVHLVFSPVYFFPVFWLNSKVPSMELGLSEMCVK